MALCRFDVIAGVLGAGSDRPSTGSLDAVEDAQAAAVGGTPAGVRLDLGDCRAEGTTAGASPRGRFDVSTGGRVDEGDCATGYRRELPAIHQAVGRGERDRGPDGGGRTSVRSESQGEEEFEQGVGVSDGFRSPHREAQRWSDADGVQIRARGGPGDGRHYRRGRPLSRSVRHSNNRGDTGSR